MNHKIATLAVSLILLPGAQAFAGAISTAKVERVATGELAVTWTDQDPVDVYVTAGPAATAKLVSANDRDGRFTYAVTDGARPFFLLRDKAGGGEVKTAERLIQLEQGSNFRDIGGYPAAEGKHVRWGLIYRSGATPLLTDADLQRIQALGLKDLVDLRSREERALAPTRVDGVRYSAVGYSMMSLIAPPAPGAPRPGAGAIYRDFPTQQAAQVRLVFDKLLARQGPVAYNCSAGQDRTGFATALILNALGVPRDVIFSDYLLSTGYRRPQFEMPPIDPAAHAGDPVALMFAEGQKRPGGPKAGPLYDSDNTPFLAIAFATIESRWGSVDNYLREVIGVGPAEVATLRAAYLE